MKIKSFLFYFAFILSSCFATAQTYKYTYYLDQGLNRCEQSKATYIGKAFDDSGLIQVDCFANSNNIRFFSIHFKDTSLEVFQGKFTSYFGNGYVRNEGFFINGVKNGVWKKRNNLNQLEDSSIYENGKIIVTGKYNYEHSILADYTLTDSVQDKYYKCFYNDKRQIYSEISFTGQNGIIKNYDSGKVTIDSIFSRDNIDSIVNGVNASFPGGPSAWKEYLQNNLDFGIAGRDNAPPREYKIIVRFIVAKDGTLTGIKPETHFGYGMEDEVIRVIKKSPPWIPAVQRGRTVKAYHRQPITFVVDTQ